MSVKSKVDELERRAQAIGGPRPDPVCTDPFQRIREILHSVAPELTDYQIIEFMKWRRNEIFA